MWIIRVTVLSYAKHPIVTVYRNSYVQLFILIIQVNH